jgi:hypothetical protein
MRIRNNACKTVNLNLDLDPDLELDPDLHSSKRLYPDPHIGNECGSETLSTKRARNMQIYVDSLFIHSLSHSKFNHLFLCSFQSVSAGSVGAVPLSLSRPHRLLQLWAGLPRLRRQTRPCVATTTPLALQPSYFMWRQTRVATAAPLVAKPSFRMRRQANTHLPQ